MRERHQTTSRLRVQEGSAGPAEGSRSRVDDPSDARLERCDDSSDWQAGRGRPCKAEWACFIVLTIVLELLTISAQEHQ